jgi:3-hydroxyacyl-[acyl-carrier-protein] dehydratase
MLTREEIKQYLPHREPMLLVDDMELDGDMGIGHYHVRGDEFFLQGHFPGKPVVPGVILCEIMGQSSSLLLLDELKNRLTLYSGLNDVRFRQPVLPGDTLTIKSKITARKGLIFFIDATAYVGDKVVCKGKLSFVLVDREK